ncbi:MULTISPECIES: MaoC family dehydratase [unclassified Nocardioides]|uniref:MaoC family dehydratase n=1 Tax=unclassified Nocardioides TaxID=2615069 RepID=UPI0006FDDF0F|nr:MULTISPECIES: MaoC family dehydratase [unclassified Nocardioides]KRA37795.1 dehydratase [Nocardioides sp. Root614]KRA91755.1 dehydratase [Nocardioides sp. Root682]
MKVYDGVAGFANAEGDVLGTSDWLEIDQARIDTFADATGDHQWIHVDAERAAEGPFGATIAHGFLTLSLLPPLLNQLYRVDNVRMAVNYGLDKVRFMAPVPVGSKIRLTARVLSVTVLEGAVQSTFESTFEIEGSEKPAAVVHSIVRYIA